MSTTIVGLYRTEADVHRVNDELVQAGFGRQELTRHDEHDPHLHDWLVDQGVPDHEADDYVQGVRAGGTLVTVEVSDDRADEAVQIMKRYEEEAVTGAAMASGAPKRRQGPIGTGTTEGERTLEVVEEELEVGTRVTEGGGVRVNTFVTERPVEKQVRVRDETVEVERRPVDRAVANAEADGAFQERSIEMTGMTEDVVVGKTARVVEEVVLRKDVNERTETVSDTVRKTDVEVVHTDDVLPEDRDYYLAHHRDTLGRDEEEYEEREIAYRFGNELAHLPNHQGRPWSEIASSAQASWARQNGEDSWRESEPAVRSGYERATFRDKR